MKFITVEQLSAPTEMYNYSSPSNYLKSESPNLPNIVVYFSYVNFEMGALGGLERKDDDDKDDITECPSIFKCLLS